MLLEDRYPPFGDAPYPASLSIVDPVGPRDRLTVGFRLLLVIPHVFVLIFLVFAWWVTTIVAWFAILFTGEYPQGLYAFGVGSLRWLRPRRSVHAADGRRVPAVLAHVKVRDNPGGASFAGPAV